MSDQKKTPATAIVGLVLAIVGLLLSALPIVNNFAFIIAIAGLALGIAGLVSTKKRKRSSGKVAISAIIISVIACVIVLASQAFYGAAIDEASEAVDESLDKATGEATDELLKNEVSVTLGDFVVTEDEYGLVETSLPVKVTNKLDETKSYSIQIEAVDANGNRISDDYVYANELGPKQTQEFKVFEFVETDKVDQMRSAEFKIVSVSQS